MQPTIRLVVFALAAIAFGAILLQSTDRTHRIFAAGLLCLTIALAL